MKIIENTPSLLLLEHRPRVGPILMALLFVVVLVVSVGLIATGVGNLMWLGLFLLVIGDGTFALLFLALSKRVRLRLDRGAGLVTLTIAGRRKTTEQSLRLADMLRAEVDTMISTSNNDDMVSSTTESYGVALVFGPDAPKQRLIASPVYTSGGGARRDVAAINAWLGVQP